MLPIVINLLLAMHVIVSLLIVLLVLMQRPKNEGLGAAFGGGMTDNLFGAQTTNVLQTITRWLGGLFFALTLLLSWLYVKQTTAKSSLQQRLLSAPAVTAPALATPAPDEQDDPAKAEAIQKIKEAMSAPVQAGQATPAREMPASATPAPVPAATPTATP